jgi:hypothetical protein
MMLIHLIVLSAILLAADAWGTIRVFDPLLTGGPCTSGNYSAGAHDCSGAIGENGYSTHTAAISPLVAGDTLRIRGGTHNIQLDFQAGNKSGTADAYITVEGYPGETAILQYSNAAVASYGAIKARGNRGYFIFQHLEIDGINLGLDTGWALRDGNHHFIIRDMRIYNQDGQAGLYIDANDITVQRNYFGFIRSDCSTGSRAYAIYAHDGVRLLIEGNELTDTPGGGIQVYSGPWDDVKILGNYIHHVNTCSSSPVGGITVGTDDNSVNSGSITNVIIAGNIVSNVNVNSSGGIGPGIRVFEDSAVVGRVVSGTKIYKNTVYKTFNNTSSGSLEYGIVVGAGVLNTEVIGNIVMDNANGQIINNGTGTTLSYNACKAADSCGTTGKVTLTALSDVLVDPANEDFRLKQGANVLLDAGTALAGVLCNGTCDVGAYESFTFSSGTISGTTAEVTLGMGLHTPASVTADGWTLNCTPSPTACPSASVSSGSLKTGTNTTASISWSGGACSTGQTWTVTYASGNTLETGPFALNQQLNSFTTQPLTNNCTGGGGGGPPGTPYILYEFDDNLSDTSGNNLHITTSNGTSFVDAKHFRGLKTDSGEDDYAEIPYFSGVNPTTQSLTIAGGVYIEPADVCSLKAVGGTPAGVSQYFHLYYSSCTWKMLIQDSTAVATEFSVQSGWNHVCVPFNAATDTATLHINGVAGAVSTASVQTYTSFIFAGNFRIGRFSGSSLAAGPNHIYDRWVVYQSVEDCGQIYENFNPPSTPYTGVIDIVQGRVYMAKSYAGSPIPIGLLSTNTTLPLGAAFATAFQAKCDNSGDCSPVGQRPYYTCTTCPSAGSELPVPDSASADGIEFWGTVSETGLLTGAHGANLSGGETHVDGGTHLTADSITVVDLCQNCSTTERWIFRIKTDAPANAQYCIFPKEQSGTNFDSYSPAAGICVSVGQANADSGP